MTFISIFKSILTAHDILWSNAVQDLSSTVFAIVLKPQSLHATKKGWLYTKEELCKNEYF